MRANGRLKKADVQSQTNYATILASHQVAVELFLEQWREVGNMRVLSTSAA